MLGTIYISFPTDPFCYERGNKMSWSQIYYFIFRGLSKEFKKIRVVPYTHKQKIPFAKDDIFITTLSDEPIATAPLYFNRCILVDNNNFDINKWKYGKFTKYGYQSAASRSSRFNEHIRKSTAQFVKTNDVAIEKWNSDHEDVYEYKKWYIDNNVNVKLMQHPIDKKHYGAFFNQEKKYNKARMIIYHAGQEKNAAQLISMLSSLGYKQGDDFDVFSHINTNDPMPILNKYMFFAHTSFSEGFPYLLNEFFTMGLIPFANEEWWGGYNFNFTKWSYNPEKQQNNIDNLKFIFDINNIDYLNKARYDIWKKHVDREDNNWDFFVGKLIEQIRAL